MLKMVKKNEISTKTYLTDLIREPLKTHEYY